MFWNPYLLPALIGGMLLYWIGARLARRVTKAWMRWSLLLLAGVLCLPGAAHALYYAHLVPTPWWYIEFRSFPGTEALTAVWGLLFGLITGCSTTRRSTGMRFTTNGLVMVLAGVLIMIPFLKPILLPVGVFGAMPDRWEGPVCLQTTPATCGPASLAAIFAHFGIRRSECEIARACYTCVSGTELWYLLRYARQNGLQARHIATSRLDELLVPSLFGVGLGDSLFIRAGHFMTLLDKHGSTYILGDPMTGMLEVNHAHMPGAYGNVHDAICFTWAK